MKINLINENFTFDYVNNLLKSRGVTNLEGYYNPTQEFLQDPLTLKNIRLAAALYMRVVRENGRILIVVD